MTQWQKIHINKIINIINKTFLENLLKFVYIYIYV